MIITLIALYLLIGLLIFFWIDSEQMKEHVPYGKVPAILPLIEIRIASAIFLSLIGAPLAICAFTGSFVQGTFKRIKLRYKVRKVDRIMVKAGPELQEYWKTVREKVLR